MPFRPLGTGGSTSWVVPALIVYVFDAGVPPSLPAEAVTLTVAARPGAVRDRVRALGAVVGGRRARADGAGGRDERRLLLVALAPYDPQGRHDRHGLVRRRQHQGARLAACDVAEVDGCRHAGLDVHRLVPGRGDQPGGGGEAHLQVRVGVAGGEGDQTHGGGVLGDAGQDQAARRVRGRGQPVAADLVVQGLHGGADPSAADVDVHGEVGLLLVGERGQQDRLAGVRLDRDALPHRGLQGAVLAVELDVDDGGRVVRVRQVDVVGAVGRRAGAREPETRCPGRCS